MRPLIAVESCHRDRHLQKTQLETCFSRWTDYPVELRFFIGRPEDEVRSPLEVFLDVSDDYYSLPFKTQAMLRWARENEFTNIFKCDTDTYVDVKRLLESGFERHAYVGCHFKGYIHGGPGYWLDADSADKVVAEPVHGWAEDSFVWETLYDKYVVPFHHDSRYVMENGEGPTPHNDVISLHVPTFDDRIAFPNTFHLLKADRLRQAHQRRLG